MCLPDRNYLDAPANHLPGRAGVVHHQNRAQRLQRGRILDVVHINESNMVYRRIRGLDDGSNDDFLLLLRTDFAEIFGIDCRIEKDLDALHDR